jgi:excisionase family DNA binding protein
MLSPREAAKRIGVSESLIYSWVETKALPHYRAGARGKRGKILIAEADLDAFLQTLRVEAREPAAEPRKVPAASRPRLALKHISI